MMYCVRFLAASLILATATLFTNHASAAEPEAEAAPFRLLEHKTVFGGTVTGAKVFFGKIPDHRAAIAEGRAMDKPEVFNSAMQLPAAIESEVIAGRIAEQVDFTKEKLVLIAWKGNAAQDIDVRVDGKGDTQQIVFSDADIRTDGGKLAKSHVYLYVVAKDAKWKFKRRPELGGPCPPVVRELELPQPPPGPNRPQPNGT